MSSLREERIEKLRTDGWFTFANESMIPDVLNTLPMPEFKEVKWVAGVGRLAVEVTFYMPKAKERVLHWLEQDIARVESQLIRYRRNHTKIVGEQPTQEIVKETPQDTVRLESLLGTGKLYIPGRRVGYILKNRAQVDSYIQDELNI